MTASTQTTCPFCGFNLPPGAPTCPSCDLPLVDPTGDDRAGYPSPNPDYSEGPLRRVTVAANQAEAELIEGLLRSERIPCLIKRNAGADVPDFLAAGRRDLLVPQGGLSAARDLLGLPQGGPEYAPFNPRGLALAVAGGAAALAAMVGLGYLLG